MSMTPSTDPIRPYPRGFKKSLRRALVGPAFHVFGVRNPLLTAREARAFFGAVLELNISPWAIMAKLPRPGHQAWPRKFLYEDKWHEAAETISPRSAQVAMSDLLEQVDVTQSKAFRRLMDRIRQGNPVIKAGQAIDTEAAARAYCQSYVSIAEDMRRNGFQRQRSHDQIEVAVGPDGVFYHLQHGNHRLGLAKSLNLNSVPIVVRYLHRDAALAFRAAFRGSYRQSIAEGLRWLEKQEPRASAGTASILSKIQLKT